LTNTFLGPYSYLYEMGGGKDGKGGKLAVSQEAQNELRRLVDSNQWP